MSKKWLKRRICSVVTLLICLSLIFSSFSFTSYATDSVSNETENSNLISREEFREVFNSVLALGEGYQSSFEVESEENGEIIIDYETSTNRLIVSTDSNEDLSLNYGAVAKIEGYNNWHIFQYKSYEEAAQAYDAFSQLSEVNYVEFDQLIESVDTEIETLSSTSYVPLSWGAERVKSTTTREALETSKRDFTPMVVAVIDTGVDITHSFFGFNTDCPRIEKNTNPNDNVDSFDSHGTHVAGIIVDNTLSNVSVKSYNYIFRGDGTTLTLATVIDDAIKDNVNIINISLGEKYKIPKEDSKVISEKIAEAVENNIPVIVAAGNDGDNASEYCIANAPEAITVAAICEDDSPTQNSNYGGCVDISAPGANICSTIRSTAESNNNFDYKTGTSMAAPFVTAAVAMLRSLDPDLTVAEIKEKLITCVDIPKDWNKLYGSGIVDFEKLIKGYRLPTPTINLSEEGATINCTAPGVSIYYTTDGTTPVIGESAVYNSELINTKNIKYIKAVAYKEGELPSYMITKSMNFTIDDVKVIYKSITELPYTPDSKIVKCYSRHPDIATVNYSGDITGVSVGETQIFVYFENNQVGTYNVKVEYDWWQWIIRILFWGFLWY